MMPGVDKVHAFCCAFASKPHERLRKALIMPHSKSQTSKLSTVDNLPELNNPRFEAVSSAAAKTLSLLELLTEALLSWMQQKKVPGNRNHNHIQDACCAGYVELRGLVSSRLRTAILIYAAGVRTVVGDGDEPESIVWEAIALVDLFASRFAAEKPQQDTMRLKGLRALALCVSRELHSTFYAAWGDHVELRKTAVGN
jgi:hypothetical protein